MAKRVTGLAGRRQSLDQAVNREVTAARPLDMQVGPGKGFASRIIGEPLGIAVRCLGIAWTTIFVALYLIQILRILTTKNWGQYTDLLTSKP